MSTLVVVVSVTGCQTVPKGNLRLSETALEIRDMQSRTYDVASEQQILLASVGVLQDMDYNLDHVEKPLGVLSASKKIDATSNKEIFGLLLMDLLCGCGATATAAESQDIMLTLVVMPSLVSDGRYVTRVTLQRIVWDLQGNAKLRELIDEPERYQEFFERLSKSIFLEVNST